MSTAKITNSPSIAETLAAWAKGFEPTLEAMLEAEPAVPGILVEAVWYSVQSGGKRVRPFLVTRFCELCGGAAEMAFPAAVAMECVHTFSLVHDDLPAMDDDDLRRGKPTCHKVYGEALGILAGDALLALAFEILATRIAEPTVASAAVAELAKGCGWAGMIGGQVSDILGEQQDTDMLLVKEIHRYKTARLFEASCRLGAISAQAEQEKSEAAAAFGRHLGEAFQIADDLLDVIGTTEQMGKAVTKDADAGKQTYPAAVGIEATRRAAAEAAQKAVAALDVFGDAADDLRELAKYVVERQK